MVKNIKYLNKKYKSQKRNKLCKFCHSHQKRYSSSSLSRHIKIVHGQGYQCDFCLKKYSEKRAHQICLEKEKYLLGIFIDGFRFDKKKLNLASNTSNFKNLSFIFDDNKDNLLCPKIKLGMGHFSNVYYAIDKETFSEIAVKLPKKKENVADYIKEANILRELDTPHFFPKVINYSEKIPIEQLKLTLMGPTLLALYNFTDGFDRKTIINILFSLLEKIKILSNHDIIHCDIKPENITWGIFRQSKIININECYLIDFGLSVDLKDNNFKEKEKNKWKIGTARYMSINAHKNIIPTTLSDLESLLYSALYLAKIFIPWKQIDSISFQKNQKILESKLSYNIEKYCGKEFHFLSQFYYYFKKIREENNPIEFEVLFDFLKQAKKEEKLFPSSYEDKYIFIKELKMRLEEFKLSGLNYPKDPKLIKLFEKYPINYHKLYEYFNYSEKKYK